MKEEDIEFVYIVDLWAGGEDVYIQNIFIDEAIASNYVSKKWKIDLDDIGWGKDSFSAITIINKTDYKVYLYKFIVTHSLEDKK